MLSKYSEILFYLMVIVIAGIVPQIMITYERPWLIYESIILTITVVWALFTRADELSVKAVLLVINVSMIISLVYESQYYISLRLYGLSIMVYAVLGVLIVLIPGILLLSLLQRRISISIEAIAISLLLGMFVLFLIGFTNIIFLKHISKLYVNVAYIILLIVMAILVLKTVDIRRIRVDLVNGVKQVISTQGLVTTTIFVFYTIMSLKVLCTTFLPFDMIRHYSWSLTYYFNGFPHVEDILWLGGRGGYPYGFHIFAASLFAILGVDESYIVFHGLLLLTLIFLFSIYSLIKHIVRSVELRNFMLLLSMTTGFSSIVLVWPAYLSSPADFTSLSWSIGTQFSDLFLQSLVLPLSVAPIRVIALPALVLIVLLSCKCFSNINPRVATMLLTVISAYTTLSHVFEALYLLITLMILTSLSLSIRRVFSFTKLLIASISSIGAMFIADYVSNAKYYTIAIDSIRGEVYFSGIILLVTLLIAFTVILYSLRQKHLDKLIDALHYTIKLFLRGSKNHVVRILELAYIFIYTTSIIMLIITLATNNFDYLYRIVKGYNTPLPALTLYLGSIGLIAYILLIIDFAKNFNYTGIERILLKTFLFITLFTSIIREINGIPYTRIQTAFGTYRYALIEKIMLLFIIGLIMSKIFSNNTHRVTFTEKKVQLLSGVKEHHNIVVIICIFLVIGIASSAITVEVASRSMHLRLPSFITPLVSLRKDYLDSSKIVSLNRYLDVYVESFTGLNATLTLKDLQNIVRDSINPFIPLLLVNDSKLYVVCNICGALNVRNTTIYSLIKDLKPIYASILRVYYVNTSIGGPLNLNNVFIVHADALGKISIRKLVSVLSSIYKSTLAVIVDNKIPLNNVLELIQSYNSSRIILVCAEDHSCRTLEKQLSLLSKENAYVDIFEVNLNDMKNRSNACNITKVAYKQDGLSIPSVNVYNLTIDKCSVTDLKRRLERILDLKQPHVRMPTILNIGFTKSIEINGTTVLMSRLDNEYVFSNSTITILPSDKPNVIVVKSIQGDTVQVHLPAIIEFNGTAILNGTYIQLYPYRIALARSIWESVIVKGQAKAQLLYSGETIMLYNLNYTRDSYVGLYNATFDILRSYKYELFYVRIYNPYTILVSMLVAFTTLTALVRVKVLRDYNSNIP